MDKGSTASSIGNIMNCLFSCMRFKSFDGSIMGYNELAVLFHLFEYIKEYSCY